LTYLQGASADFLEISIIITQFSAEQSKSLALMQAARPPVFMHPAD